MVVPWISYILQFFLARRSRVVLGKSNDFWGSLHTDVLQVIWHHVPAGTEALGLKVSEFIEAKLVRGTPELTEEQQAKFIVDLGKEITQAGQDLTKAGHLALGAHWSKMGAPQELQKLAKKFSWFSKEIRWTN